jgi:hypothetical protein
MLSPPRKHSVSPLQKEAYRKSLAVYSEKQTESSKICDEQDYELWTPRQMAYMLAAVQ